MHKIVLTLSFVSLLGCGASHSVCGSEGPAPTCLRGWSGSASCCLESDAVAPSCVADTWMCPAGYFTESDCGRVDSMCEGIDGGPCPGTGPTCYQGAGAGSASCCYEGFTTAATCDTGWTCPAGFYTRAACGRVDTICEGPDAGVVSGGPYDDCTVTSDCQIVANTCCGVCGVPTADDMAAIATRRSTEYYREVACPESIDGPVACPECLTRLNPHLVATCDMTGVRPACAQVDLGAPPYSTCSVDSDCSLATPTCCACSEIGLSRTIAVNSAWGRDLNSLLCDTDASCPPCVPIFDPSARAACEAGVCVVVTM